MRLTVLTSRF